MKKRILAMLLALVLMFSLLPSVVIAEGEEHIHCLCGANTVKDTVCDNVTVRLLCGQLGKKPVRCLSRRVTTI